ncbi:hypothetical protein CK203_092679 [Vitis vinifera]|uniref:Uncharacterized protein n=1 Tax=Vitis vinifera TaxID=29760 RepID=A0A438EP39_VITVI|nr:hypothetical protein CK203_092679 [Vitis vinifera]
MASPNVGQDVTLHEQTMIKGLLPGLGQ